ncbi:MAG: glycosyltransferase [Hyphomicrobiaceae bacterium]
MNSPPGGHEIRSALDDYPGHAVPNQPSVAIVIPVFNEIDHLPALMADVRAQDYPGIATIFLADGNSTDGSLDALNAWAQDDPRVEVVNNPRRVQAAAINAVFMNAATDIVMRLDAHARYAPDVVSACVAVLLETGAGGVGAAARPAEQHTAVGRAIALAHKSRLGVGVAKFRQEDAEGWADTIWNGCYWRHVVARVGPMREDLWRAEDNDFNERVRRLGYRLYISPRVVAHYKTRQSFSRLWQQYFDTGMSTILAMSVNPRAFSFRHLVPLAFVLSLIVPQVLAFVWPPFSLVSMGVLAIYLCALALATAVAGRNARSIGAVALLPVALMVLHLAYGAGSLAGVFRLAGRSVTSMLRRPGLSAGP